MSTTYESVAVLQVLLPGFLASSILNALQKRREVTTFVQLMESLAFSFVIRATLALIGEAEPIASRITGDGTPPEVLISATPLVLAVVLAIVLPTVLSALIEHDVLLKPWRWAKVTSRTGRASMWLDLFTNNRQYVVVYFKDGDRIMGWPLAYSEPPEAGMVYLSEARWIDENDQYDDANAEGVFICNPDEVSMITFLHNDEEQGG